MSDDDKVGPGRPPKHSRWKKGQSGNPKGRPKGHLDVKSVLEEELLERITLATPQGEREMTKLQAVIRRLIHEGMSGKVYAIQDILDRAERLGRTDETSTSPELARDDEAILRRALSSGPPPGSDSSPPGADGPPPSADGPPSPNGAAHD